MNGSSKKGSQKNLHHSHFKSKITNYINDNTFRFTVYENTIHVINYKRILILEEDRISFQSKNQKIKIEGEGLILKKILNQEMLITGKIYKIEVSYE